MGRTRGPRYYTTSKPARKFVAEIMELLSDYGAESFMVQQEGGQPVAVAFSVSTDRGSLALRLRPDVDAIQRRLEEEGVAGHSSTAPAEAVAWAQTRHLLELQLEAVENGVARPTEVFGGYVLTDQGRTVSEMIDERVGELLPGERLLLPG